MNPAPLPEPPSDYGELAARFPYVRKDRLPSEVWRVHRLDREPEWFSADGSGRWDPPPTSPRTFGTCYVALEQPTAFIEVFGDFDLITEKMVEERCFARIAVRDDLKLADMTSRRLLGEWGLDQRISVGDDYDICQRWANALHLAGFAGVYYPPRHDTDPGSVDRSIGLFGDPGHQPTQLRVQHDGLAITADLLAHVRAEFGIHVVPSAPVL